jgi:hypothetical protein
MDRLKLRGIKRHCQNKGCALPFYDLNRAEVQCPNCGANFVAEPVREPPRFPRRPGMTRPRWPTAPVDVLASEAVVVDEVEAPPEVELEETPGTGALLEVEIEDDADGGIIEPSGERAIED